MTDTIDRLKTALADRYTIERELGSGSMATVYLASGFPCAEARARPQRVNAPRLVLKDPRNRCPSGHVPKGPSPGFNPGIS